MIGMSPALCTLIQNLLWRSCKYRKMFKIKFLYSCPSDLKICIDIVEWDFGDREGLQTFQIIIFSTLIIMIYHQDCNHQPTSPASYPEQRRAPPLCQSRLTFAHRQSRRSLGTRPWVKQSIFPDVKSVFAFCGESHLNAVNQEDGLRSWSRGRPLKVWQTPASVGIWGGKCQNHYYTFYKCHCHHKWQTCLNSLHLGYL